MRRFDDGNQVFWAIVVFDLSIRLPKRIEIEPITKSVHRIAGPGDRRGYLSRSDHRIRSARFRLLRNVVLVHHAHLLRNEAERCLEGLRLAVIPLAQVSQWEGLSGKLGEKGVVGMRRARARIQQAPLFGTS
jgi:hypothetical protein